MLIPHTPPPLAARDQLEDAQLRARQLLADLENEHQHTMEGRNVEFAVRQ